MQVAEAAGIVVALALAAAAAAGSSGTSTQDRLRGYIAQALGPQLADSGAYEADDRQPAYVAPRP